MSLLNSLLAPFVGAGTLSICVGIVTTYILWYIASSVITWSRLRQFPGPTLASFSYLWGYFAMRTGRVHRRFSEEHEKYGKIIRIGPSQLMVYDPDILWQINSVRSAYTRGGQYNSVRFDPYEHNVLSEPSMTRHDRLKAKMASAYAGKGNLNLEKDVDSQLAILVDLIRRRYANSSCPRALDFSLLARYFQVDVVTLVTIGEPWGDLVTEEDQFGFISLTNRFVPFMHCFSMVPILRDLFASRLFLSLAGPKATDKQGMGKYLGIIQNIVNGRLENGPEKEWGHNAMLDEWIRNGMSRRECEVELALQVPAGSETVTTALEGVFFHLLATPHAYQKFKTEISDAIHHGLISDPITNEEAKRLPYLQAIIYEGLRMMPPVLSGFPKRVPPEGDTIDGVFVPGGTEIFINTWNMARNKAIFGLDVDIFRPERFLECGIEARARMAKTIDLIFGHGRWQCPGKTLAWIELNKFFVQLFRNFDFQIINPEQPWHCRAYSSFLVNDFWVRATETSPVKF